MAKVLGTDTITRSSTVNVMLPHAGKYAKSSQNLGSHAPRPHTEDPNEFSTGKVLLRGMKVIQNTCDDPRYWSFYFAANSRC